MFSLKSQNYFFHQNPQNRVFQKLQNNLSKYYNQFITKNKNNVILIILTTSYQLLL